MEGAEGMGGAGSPSVLPRNHAGRGFQPSSTATAAAPASYSRTHTAATGHCDGAGTGTRRPLVRLLPASRAAGRSLNLPSPQKAPTSLFDTSRIGLQVPGFGR